MAMFITERDENGVALFTLSGRIDGHTASNLDAVLDAAVSNGENRMVLDMGDVQYIGSTGLRTLVKALARLRERGGDLKLVALSGNLLRALRIVGFDSFFSLHDTLEGALGCF